MREIEFKRLEKPTKEIAALLEKWNNDPGLVPLIRYSPTKEKQESYNPVTVESLGEILKVLQVYIILDRGKPVGEFTIQIDPPQCLSDRRGTAWLGITIGEKEARGRGIGERAVLHMEETARLQGLERVELGVFEFNEKARRLYKKLGYREFGRIDNFTWWNDRMWQDIRMEKTL